MTSTAAPLSVASDDARVAARDASGFRRDINGLRAWAVLAVVGYHFHLPGFRGGYVGVDIFFVISGFLMTRIIVTQLASGGARVHTILAFYLARAARIVPALLVVCVTLVACGWAVLPVAEYQTLCRHVAGALGFASNLQYLQESGYFDAASADKWLLHTWSLSVEWQFYLILPVLLSLIWRRWPRVDRLAQAIAIGLVASWIFCVAWTPAHPSAAFFLLPTRAWEMFAGGLVCLYADRLRLTDRQRVVVESIGIALIVLSIAVFTTTTPWPGWRASMPIVGAAAILFARRTTSIWTQTRVAQWVGSASYSIYLWHWPVVVLLAYFNLQRDKPSVVVGVLATLVLGWLSYRWVETSSRVALQRLRVRARACWLSGLFVLVMGFALVAMAFGGSHRALDRGDFRERDLVMPLSSNGYCFRNVVGTGSVPIDDRHVPCTLGRKGAPRAGLLIGDSFAGQYEPFWDRVGQQANLRLDAVTTNWCFPSTDDGYSYLHASPAYAQCLVDRRFMKQHLGDYDFVVFAGYWRVTFDDALQEGLFAAIADAAARLRLVVVMAAPTEFDADIALQFRRREALGLPFDARRYANETDIKSRAANDAIERYCARFPNVIFVRRDALFHIDGVSPDMTRDGVPFSLDGRHVSVYGSLTAAEVFMRTPVFDAFLVRVTRGVAAGPAAPRAHSTLDGVDGRQ